MVGFGEGFTLKLCIFASFSIFLGILDILVSAVRLVKAGAFCTALALENEVLADVLATLRWNPKPAFVGMLGMTVKTSARTRVACETCTLCVANASGTYLKTDPWFRLHRGHLFGLAACNHCDVVTSTTFCSGAEMVLPTQPVGYPNWISYCTSTGGG